MSDFTFFQEAVSKQFDAMAKNDLFCTGVDKDAMWQHYLDSFPSGTNRVFRKRAEYDCSCCRQFVRNAGNIVSIVDGRIVSIWDVSTGIKAYDAVAAKMAAFVRSNRVADLFLSGETVIGTRENYEDDDGQPRRWMHFCITMPRSNAGKTHVCKREDVATRLGEASSSRDVFLRALREITVDAVDTVSELVASKTLYRGEDYKFVVTEFGKLQREFVNLEDRDAQELFAWSRLSSTAKSVQHVRSSAIGTLLVDLSEGLDLEDAVRKYEAVVAPQNYKRSTALVTESMVKAAKAQVEELGLESAMRRRYARLEDVSVRDILFVDRSARKQLKSGGAFDDLPTKPSAKPKNLDKVETISIEKFLEDVVPNVETVEVMFESSQVGNLVSLVAPADAKSAPLFKWSNRFSWSYNGDVADSIKERVKRAGGSVTGDVCCRLSWSNYDDLDLHMQEPGRYEIYFANRGLPSPSGGMLDVDMNAGSGETREPVENIFYASKSRMREGVYKLFVHNFCKRESVDVGFEVEVDLEGTVLNFAYDKAVSHDQNVGVIEFEYSRAKGFEVLKSLPASGGKTRTAWGVETNKFHRVNVLMKSPNYWDGEVGIGNEHYFFMLDGCVNDGVARGFYNEFLRSELDKHRKVLEIVGGRTKTEASDHQLSGLGFSSTRRAEVLVRVKGNFTRTLKVLI